MSYIEEKKEASEEEDVAEGKGHLLCFFFFMFYFIFLGMGRFCGKRGERESGFGTWYMGRQDASVTVQKLSWVEWIKATNIAVLFFFCYIGDNDNISSLGKTPSLISDMPSLLSNTLPQTCKAPNFHDTSFPLHDVLSEFSSFPLIMIFHL